MKKVTDKHSPPKLLEKKQARAPEQPTPPIQEEPEPVSNVLQGDDILALAIKREDLKKQHIPPSPEPREKSVFAQKFIIRKLKPKDPSRKVYHWVAHPANPDAATKPLDYSGPSESFSGSEEILPHQILGTLQDFKRIAVARGNTQLAKMIRIQPCRMTLISAEEEPKPKAPKEEKRPPWAPPLQHNFLKNWRRHTALWKKQQKALSENLKKPVSELLMLTGETFRKNQEEREIIDRALPTQHDMKGFKASNLFWSPLEYLGDERTGLLMTKTKTQRGLVEPITYIRKPRSIRIETGLPAQQEAWYRYTWDRSLFLIYRRKELQSIMAELDFSQKDIDGLEVVGHGKPFSSVTVEEYPSYAKSQENSSEETVDSLASFSDVPMPILGPSLLFCGKPACWIRGSNPEDKKNIGIGVRLTFETLQGEKTSSELTVVNNGTVAIWYDWRRQPLSQSFQDLKRTRMQRFYFNNREGVILPGETKNFTFFFKSLDAGIFRESWEFRTHPTLLGGAALQVALRAVSLAQDIFRDERKFLENKLATHEVITIAQNVLQEVLRGVSTPERIPSPMDAYVTEEDLFCYRNPRLHYQHQVVQNLYQLWDQYLVQPLKTEEATTPSQEGSRSRARTAPVPFVYTGKTSAKPDQSTSARSPVSESPQSQQEVESVKDPQDSSLSNKTGTGTKSSPRKSIMEEILVEENLDVDNAKSPWEQESPSFPKWNLCLEDFRKAVMTLPEEPQREDALIRLNKAAMELCQEQKPLQSNILHQMCLQLWRDVIDNLVNHSLWLRALLGLPEKERVYLDIPEEPDRKPSPLVEVKVTSGKVGKEERKGAAQEKKQLGIKDKEDKKGGAKERVNSKKQKTKDDKKVVKSSSQDRLSSEDPTTDSSTPSQEPIDPLILDKYTQRLHAQVYELLNALVTELMVLTDELGPSKSVEEPLRLCS